MALVIGTNTDISRQDRKLKKGREKPFSASQRYDSIEDKMIDCIDLKTKLLQIAEHVLPLLEGDAKVGDITKMLDKLAPVAVMRLMDVVVNGNAKTAAAAAKDLLHMAGYKPVEKSINISDNIERMSEQQLDAFLGNAFKGMNKSEKENLVKLIEGPDGTFTPIEVEKEEL